MNSSISSNKYLSIWLFFIFITSFVVTNSVKGTTPAFIFAIMSLPVALLFANRKVNYLITVFSLIGLYILTQLVSQTLLLFITPPDYGKLILVSNDSGYIFRASLFTQSIYLICSFLTLCFTSLYYIPCVHDKYLSMSIIVFVTAGFIFWIFYLVSGLNGDLISNREYSDGLINPGQFQPISINGINIARFVSLTGEPSMYVYSLLPYFIYTLHYGYTKTALYILISLTLTLSGTFIIGMFLYTLCIGIYAFNKKSVLYLISAIVALLILFTISSGFKEIVYEVLISKLLQESDSGLDRFASIFMHLSFFSDLPFSLMLTGMGFGFIRSPDLLSTLLVNVGIIGFLLFSYLLLYPAFILSKKKEVGLKIALIVTYVILLISVSEYSYPSLWLLVGIAYGKTPIVKKLKCKRFNIRLS